MEAFLIVEKQGYVIENYKNDPLRSEWVNNGLTEFNNYFSNININNYKGISRNALAAESEKTMYKSGIKELDAVHMINKILGEKAYLYPDELIKNEKDCLKVYKKIKEKEKYEIIKTEKDEYSDNNNNFLGYDIGYWGGDNFSIISDSMLLPMWHGPTDEAMIKLKEYSNKLNKNILFNTFEDANEFREYYLNQEWAEKEMTDGEICIQKITLIDRK